MVCLYLLSGSSAEDQGSGQKNEVAHTHPGRGVGVSWGFVELQQGSNNWWKTAIPPSNNPAFVIFSFQFLYRHGQLQVTNDFQSGLPRDTVVQIHLHPHPSHTPRLLNSQDVSWSPSYQTPQSKGEKGPLEWEEGNRTVLRPGWRFYPSSATLSAISPLLSPSVEMSRHAWLQKKWCVLHHQRDQKKYHIPNPDQFVDWSEHPHFCIEIICKL